jgi:hypothetical protein
MNILVKIKDRYNEIRDDLDESWIGSTGLTIFDVFAIVGALSIVEKCLNAAKSIF